MSKPRYLITSSNEVTWKFDRPVLFLNHSCLNYKRKHIWSKINHEVLPSHWNNPEQTEERFYYLKSVYEKYLKILASKLNEIHGENYPLRYWRITLGPWLNTFTGIIYDRYLAIMLAKESDLVSHTWIPPINHEDWVPTDFANFRKWAYEDNFNLYLYGRIITQLRGIPYTIKNIPSFSNLSSGKFFEELNSKFKICIK